MMIVALVVIMLSRPKCKSKGRFSKRKAQTTERCEGGEGEGIAFDDGDGCARHEHASKFVGILAYFRQDGRQRLRTPLSNNFSFSMADRLAVSLLKRARPQRPLSFSSPCTFSLCRSYFATPSVQAGAVKKRMPPKKAAQPEKKILLGRPSNNLKIGIVGLFGLSFTKL